MMQVEMAALTHKGMVRDNNEDAMYFDESDRVVILCDGMGGHTGGQVASEIAVQVMSGIMRSLKPEDWRHEDKLIDTIKDAVFGANDHILQRAHEDHSLFDMGTTMVACVYMDDKVITANVGDSRIYRIADNTIEQISEDHSLVNERIQAGLIEAGSSEARMLSNILTRALGMDQVTVDITVEDMCHDDIYLMCTDGLSDLISDDDMFDIVMRNHDLQLACVGLVELANERGGHDNISVALTHVTVPENA